MIVKIITVKFSDVILWCKYIIVSCIICVFLFNRILMFDEPKLDEITRGV